MLGVMCAIRLEIQGVVILSGVRARFHFSRGSCGRANAVEGPLFAVIYNSQAQP
jgi:hypothetical protein